MSDIFSLFPNSIEQVVVKSIDRGALDPSATFEVTLNAIVKRRKSMAEATNESEDYQNNTTIHFMQKDVQYIAVGNYVKIDDEWHSIIDLKDGKDFNSGASEFVYATIGNDIIDTGNDPVWSVGVSA